jgi:hypothetical protein
MVADACVAVDTRSGLQSATRAARDETGAGGAVIVTRRLYSTHEQRSGIRRSVGAITTMDSGQTARKRIIGAVVLGPFGTGNRHAAR